MIDKAGTARPWLFRTIRVSEGVALVVLIYGLASSRWLIAAGGALAIIATYGWYRRHFRVIERADDGSMGMSDGGD